MPITDCRRGQFFDPLSPGRLERLTADAIATRLQAVLLPRHFRVKGLGEVQRNQIRRVKGGRHAPRRVV